MLQPRSNSIDWNRAKAIDWSRGSNRAPASHERNAWLRALPLSAHWVYCAVTGYGKDELSLCRLTDAALAGPERFAIVSLLPFGNMCEKFPLQLVKHRQTHRVLYDRFASTGPVTLGFEDLPFTGDEAKDSKRINRWMSWLVQHREQMDALLTPMLRIGLRRFGRLAQHQPAPVPKHWLLDAAEDPESDAFQYLGPRCLHDKTRRAMRRYAALSRRERDAELQCVVRVFDEVLDPPSIKARDGGIITPAHWREFLNKGGIYIGDGTSADGEDVSAEERRHQQVRIIQWTIEACQQGVGPDVILFLNEPFVEGLIDKRLSDGFAACRNNRCFIHLCIQDITAIDPAIRANIDANSSKLWGRQGSAGAELVERGMGACLMDDDLTWYTETETRQVHAGTEWITKRGESRRKDRGRTVVTDNSSQTPVQTYREEQRERRFRKPYEMQATDLRAKLQTLGKGWFYAQGEQIADKPRYCHMLEVPWTEEEQKRRWAEALQQIMARPEYRTVEIRNPPPAEFIDRRMQRTINGTSGHPKSNGTDGANGNGSGRSGRRGMG